MDNNYTYTDAFNELQAIVTEIEIGEANIDELASKIKRATELITVCKAKLTASEDEVNNLLAGLAQDNKPESAEVTEEEE